MGTAMVMWNGVISRPGGHLWGRRIERVFWQNPLRVKAEPQASCRTGLGHAYRTASWAAVVFPNIV
jgi:hypothetical protein